MARGQDGDRFHRRKQRGAPQRERSAGALPRRRLLKRETNRAKGASEWVWGRRNSPCPRYNPQPAPHSDSTALEGGSTAGSSSTALEGGSTASATTWFLDQRLKLKKPESKAKRTRGPTRQHTHTHTTGQKQLKHRRPHETEQALASLRKGRWPEPPMFESIGMAPRRTILGPMTNTHL